MFRLMVSKHCPDGRGAPGRPGPNEKRSLKMSILLNRVLDVVVSFALVGMALTVAGATAVLGA